MEEVFVLGDASGGDLVRFEIPEVRVDEPMSVILWRIETPEGYSHYESSEVGRDAEIAWAMAGKNVFAEAIIVPAHCVIDVREGGSVDLRWF